jgi:hypothetical protein
MKLFMDFGMRIPFNRGMQRNLEGVSFWKSTAAWGFSGREDKKNEKVIDIVLWFK